MIEMLIRDYRQFGLAALKTQAFESIKDQLTVDNIVQETFSRFSSQFVTVLARGLVFSL